MASRCHPTTTSSCRGVLVHAFGRSGETALCFIPRQEEGIVIEIGKLRAGFTSRKPWLVSFIIGLIHGLGFAGVLAEMGLPGQ